MTLRLSLLLVITFTLLRCTPSPPATDPVDPAAIYLARYHERHPMSSVSWSGYIGIVTPRIDELVLPYRFNYQDNRASLTLLSPLGTTMGEIIINQEGTTVNSALAPLVNLEELLADLETDSLEIAPADAYSYFWGIPLLSATEQHAGIEVSFDQQNLPRRFLLEEEITRELEFRFREMPDGSFWPKRIRLLDPNQLQLTITIREPQYEE